MLDGIPHDLESYAADLGLAPEDLLPAREHFAGLMFQPTLNIAGLKSGYQGEGVKTVLPGKATVKIDVRLVVNQDPEDIYSKFVQYVKERAPRVRERRLGGAVPPARSSFETPPRKRSSRPYAKPGRWSPW